MEWVSVAVQAGGAIAVCGMFLWFLKQKQIADDSARNEFLEHLSNKDKRGQEAADKQMEYLRSRDAQSKDIAMSGHDALREISKEVAALSLFVKGGMSDRG